MAEKPIVTMGMAVYNGERTIAESMRSVLSEAFTDFEFLLVDDGSTDASLTVIGQFDDPRIRVLRNDGNQGLVATRNRIAREARGTYLAWLDQDDLSDPQRMATQVDHLERNPMTAVCGGQTAMLVEQRTGGYVRRVERFPTDHATIRAAMLFLNPIACNTVMMRRAVFPAEPFRAAFGNSLDYDLWSRASDTMTVVNLPVVLGSYRVHGGQTSQGAALDRMNRHALDVQAELAERALGMQWNEHQRGMHACATTAPIVVSDEVRLSDIAEWLCELRIANESAKERGFSGFDARCFETALARQWTTVCLAARATLGTRTAARWALSGKHRIGFSARAGIASTRDGLIRRARRRR